MKISILCPTRNRPDFLSRMIGSARDTANNPDLLEFVVYIDNDDVSYDAVLPSLNVTTVRGERIVLSEMWNKCWEQATGEIYGHLGDDIIFRTQGWDDVVREKMGIFPDKIAFVYGRDGYSPDDFGTHGFIHKNWTGAVGYFVPPYFSSDFNDTWLNDVAKMIDRHIFAPEIYTEHMHFINNKAPVDITHKERLERHKRDNVEGLYQEKEPERRADADRLRAVMDTAPLLSILIPTVVPRTKSLNRLLHYLTSQIKRHDIGDKVDVLVYRDNFEMGIGPKRNYLLSQARGRFVVFVDDDDSIASDYVRTVVETIRNNPDIDYIGYRVMCVYDGCWSKDTFHSLRYPEPCEDDDGYYRNISHINPIRRAHAIKALFPDVVSGEDTNWNLQVMQNGCVRREVFLDRPMYLYNFNTFKTLANQKLIATNKRNQDAWWQIHDIDMSRVRLVGNTDAIDWGAESYG